MTANEAPLSSVSPGISLSEEAAGFAKSQVNASEVLIAEHAVEAAPRRATDAEIEGLFTRATEHFRNLEPLA